MAFTDNVGTYMPVVPANNSGGCGFGNCFGGDGAWWILILFLFMMMGKGANTSCDNSTNAILPYLMSNSGANDVQRGFDQQSVMTGLNGISSNINNGFANTANSLCGGFANVNANVNNGFANAESAAAARQMANMQQQFASQTAITSGMSNLQAQLAQCCCDNRLATANLNSTILSENCADRNALSESVTQLLINSNNNTQRIVDTTNAAVRGIYDKICQLELNAKNDKIAELERKLTMSNFAASRAEQTAAIEQYIAPNPKPAYIVQNPNGCNCGNYYQSGCCA